MNQIKKWWSPIKPTNSWQSPHSGMRTKVNANKEWGLLVHYYQANVAYRCTFYQNQTVLKNKIKCMELLVKTLHSNWRKHWFTNLTSTIQQLSASFANFLITISCINVKNASNTWKPIENTIALSQWSFVNWHRHGPGSIKN